MSGSGQADPGSRSRDSGLDFLKGFLVLVMVVHHSLEYFLGPRYPVIKYFDFVTGAFVFVAGFIVSSISGTRPGLTAGRNYWRLVQRGWKVVLLFLIVNLAINLVVKVNYNGRHFGVAQFVRESYSVFWLGNKAVASFEILLPIAYTLLASALLLTLFRSRLMRTLPVMALVAYCSLLEDPSFNLYYLCLGLCGFAAGVFADRGRIQVMVEKGCRAFFILFAGVYFALISWLPNDNLPLYLFGILAVVGLVYLYAVDFNYGWPVNHAVVLLGKYSLLGYLAHILFLQLLYRLVQLPILSEGCAIIPFVLASAFLFGLCYATEALRRWHANADYVYRLIFA